MDNFTFGGKTLECLTEKEKKDGEDESNSSVP